ncbi:MAG: hypothetical protein DWI07_02565 [Planctomycetota bacterium]|nr:MAG: hypothetical protein DWI07_02565 [Planctomycetota bacterium]
MVLAARQGSRQLLSLRSQITNETPTLFMNLIPDRSSATLPLIVGLWVVIASGVARGGTWVESFEGKFSRNYFVEPQELVGGWSNQRINPGKGYFGPAGEVSLVKDPVRSGAGAMKCVRSEKGRRMEFELVNREEKDSPRVGEDCWAAVSIMAPAESVSHSGMVVQWHGGFPGKAEGKEYAQGPEACLRLDNGQFIYRTNYKPSKEAEPGNRVGTLVEKVVPGQWYDFVFHHSFSLKDEGLTEIWVQGKKVYSQQGCNAFYYRGKFAFKFGSYGSGTGGTLYFDDAKVVTGAGSYEQVSPGGVKPLPQATPETVPASAKSNAPATTEPGGEK